MLALNVTVVLLFTVLSHTGQLYNATMKLNQRFFPKEMSFQSILEISYLLNLAIVGGSVLYVDAYTTETKDTVIHTSVVIAFLEFIGIVAYHFWCAVKPYILRFVRNSRRGYQNLDRDCVAAPTTSTVDMGANEKPEHDHSSNYKSSHVREPLLTESPI